MSDTRDKLIREKVDLINAIDYAMRDFDDYLDECNELCTPPIDKLEDFIADGVISAGYRKKQEWIPVSERLPENFVSVLGYMTDAGEFPPVRECYTVGNAFFFPALRDVHPVSHWMPIPEPPVDTNEPDSDVIDIEQSEVEL